MNIVFQNSNKYLNEICQLYIDDIKISKGIWYFHINDERDDQHIKNPQSNRIVPIHPVLIDLGILEYARSSKKCSCDTLL